jgi:hypothetical protein
MPLTYMEMLIYFSDSGNCGRLSESLACRWFRRAHLRHR